MPTPNNLGGPVDVIGSPDIQSASTLEVFTKLRFTNLHLFTYLMPLLNINLQ